MKKIRRAATLLLTLCLFCSSISTVVYAAAGQLQFSDPSTTVGAEVDVKVRLASTSGVKTLEASLTYDKEALRFVSGDSATGGDGTVSISGSGTGNELVLMMKFQALKEGAVKITVASATGTTTAGQALEITNGSATVTIGPGDPSLIQPEAAAAAPTGDGAQVTVDDKAYVITNNFSDALIPDGFTKTEMSYEGTACQVVKQEASGTTAMYLTPAAGGDADFFLYNGDKGEFSPFESVDIAQDRYIVLLRDDGTVKLPKAYQETTLTLNGKEFPVWQNTEQSDYYVVYALNSDGQKTLYQYDNIDKTYQRYIKAKTDSSTETATPKGIFGKVTQFMKDHLNTFLIGAWALFIILLIIIIVVAVKLRHRNIELDDLYDEYGIDEEPQTSKKDIRPMPNKVAKKEKDPEPAIRKPIKKQIDAEDFEEYDDGEDLMADDFDEDFESLEEADEEDYGDDFYEEAHEFNEDEIEDLDAMLSERPKKKRSHMEDDDAFKVDFIDLD